MKAHETQACFPFATGARTAEPQGDRTHPKELNENARAPAGSAATIGSPPTRSGSSRALAEQVTAYLGTFPNVRAQIIERDCSSGCAVEATLTLSGRDYRAVVEVPDAGGLPSSDAYDLAKSFGLRIYLGLYGQTPVIGGPRRPSPIALRWTRPSVKRGRAAQLPLVTLAAGGASRR